MSNNSLEIVHEGWLTKSPPTKPIWRAKVDGHCASELKSWTSALAAIHSKWRDKRRWRRRWFVLRHSGELPGQYFLEYYTDRNCRKLKGKIDLDQCEQVDAGLRFETNKQKYQHMFDVKTPKRIYYLAAESEEEMNKWVEYVCHVCGLKAYKDDEDEYDYGGGGEDEETAASAQAPLALPSGDNLDPALSTSTESPPVSPTSTISGPYIPISECISGKPLSTPNGLEDFNNIIRQGGYGSATNAQYGMPTNAVSTSQSWRTTLKSNNQSTDSQKSGGSQVANSEDVAHPLPAKTLSVKKVNKPGYEAYPLQAHVSEFYDSPRKLHPPNLELSQGGNHTPPLHSPTDAESVFTDDEWTAPVHPPPSVNWETFPNADPESAKQGRPSDSSADVELSTDIGSWSVKQRYGKYTIVDSALPTVHHTRQPPTIPHPVAPPRPPKPLHLSEMPSHNYLNLENVSPKPMQAKPKPSAVSASSSSVCETSKRVGGAPNSPNECASAASEGAEEPPSPGAAEVIAIGGDDEMYDFPRSHQCANTVTISEPEGSNTVSKFGSLSRHCYSNAAPGQVNGEIFRYDFQHPGANTNILVTNELEEPVSPHSEGSGSITSTNNVIYSNLPSPLSIQSASGVIEGNSGLPTPPAVNRGLKPGRKLSDSTSVVSSEPSPGGPFTSSFPPCVDRTLKPQRKYLEAPSTDLGGPIQLSSPPTSRVGSDGTRSLRKTRAAPSPTPPSSMPAVLWNGQKQRSDRNSSSDEDPRVSQDDEQIYYYQQENRFIPVGPGKRLQEIQYLDLDLDPDASGSLPSSQIPKSPERAPTTGTVYKTVDFVKTEAFNRTRQKLEEERKLGPEL